MAKRLNQSAAVSGAALCAVVTVVAGCGEEPQSIFADNTAPPPEPPPLVQEGVLRDGIVSGLGFVSGAESGITEADGLFTCETGREVTFSIGAVAIGSTDCATLVMPPSLSPSGNLDDSVTINVARFLQMLDRDGDQMTLVPFDGGNNRSASGTVLFDAEGVPLGVSGEWLNGGQFQAAACRLT